MTDTAEARTLAVRTLNDAARTITGIPYRATTITIGVQSLPEEDRMAIFKGVVAFDAFTPDNDPHGEHDFGALYQLAAGEWTPHRPADRSQIMETVFWKFDYYDNQLEFGSEAPWDATQTKRVLTILLASEY